MANTGKPTHKTECVGRTVESYMSTGEGASARKVPETQISKLYSSPTPMLFAIGLKFCTLYCRDLIKILKWLDSLEISWTNEFCGVFCFYFIFQIKADLAWNSITVRDPTLSENVFWISPSASIYWQQYLVWPVIQLLWTYVIPVSNRLWDITKFVILDSLDYMILHNYSVLHIIHLLLQMRLLVEC